MRKTCQFLIICFSLIYFSSCFKNEKKKNSASNLEARFSKKIKTITDANNFYQYSKGLKNDSIYSNALLKLTRFAFSKKEWVLFHQYRLEYINTERYHSYSKNYAKILHYSGYFFNERNQDSTYYYYYKACKYYTKVKDSSGIGQMLLNIAILQKELAIYDLSEDNSYRSIPYLEAKKKNREIASINNNLGLIYFHRKEYTKSIRRHRRAYDIRKNIVKKKELEIQSLNNIGLNYKAQEKYKEAQKFFLDGLKYDSILEKKPSTHANLLDNYAHTLFLNQEKRKQAIELLLNAYSIREENNDYEGLITSTIHLAEYYNSIKNKEKAIYYAELAEEHSKTAKNYTDYIKNLDFLSSLYDNENKQEIENKYLRIEDSIKKANDFYREEFWKIKNDIDGKQNLIFTQGREIEYGKTIILILIITTTSLILISFGINLSRKWKKEKLQKAFSEGFQNYLIQKYNLTKENIDFWEAWVTGLNQKELSEKLFISEDAIKSRRKSLKNRIAKIQKIEGKFTQVMGTNIYNQEKELYNETFKKDF